MKKIQQLCAPILLSLLLSVSVYAGDGIITIGKAEPTPTPATMTATSTDAEGIITIGRTATDPVTEVALSMLQTVLALF
jgi:hypothetical protein